MSVPDFDSHFTLQELEDLWKELKKKGSKRFESILKKKSGEIFPVDITANYIEFEGKEFLVAFTHDITNRKLAEAAILKSENEFRKIFEKNVSSNQEKGLGEMTYVFERSG